MRRLLPRTTLRNLDNAESRYPHTRRTGDPRIGTSGGPFNDNDTLIYSRSRTVSYPTTLPTDNRNLASDLTSSISAVGSFTQGVAENFVTVTRTLSTYKPFIELGLHEQDLDKSSVMYRTGSNVSELGLGFKAPLGEKTKIRFELPVKTAVTLDPLTSSAYYYNKVEGTFQEIAPSEKTDPNPIIQGTPSRFAFSYPFLDVKFFDALGNYASSGAFGKMVSYISDVYSFASYARFAPFYSNALQEEGVETLISNDDAGVTRNSKYAASTSQSFNVGDFSDTPFLLERATLEFPFQAGSNWFNDRTRVAQSHGVNDETCLGLGGPCVMVSLFNQISPTRRELIMSASIIPQGDDTSEIIRSTSVPPFAPAPGYKQYRSVQGFTALGAKPTVVIPSGSSHQFAGTLRFDMEARVSNGLVYMKPYFRTYADYASYTTTTAPLSPFQSEPAGYVYTVSPFGRSKSGEVSGRSIFGRDVGSPGNSKIVRLKELGARLDVYGTASGSLSDLAIQNVQGNVISPYLLTSTDNLVLVVSKYHSSPQEQTVSASYNSFPLTASHDVTIPVGTIKMTLFGSQVREQAEFHDTLNQNVTSNAVHYSTIVGSPVVDQWNLEARSTYSGSYTDVYVTGSAALVNGSSARGAIGSRSSITSSIATSQMLSDRLKYPYEIVAGTQLFAQASSPNERFWDSMVPGVDEIALADGARAWMGWNSFANAAIPGDDVITLAVDAKGVLRADYEFSKGYPFAPQYSTLDRKLEVKRFKGANKMVTAAIVEVRPETIGAALLFETGRSPALFGDSNVYAGTQLVAASKNDINKFFFGIGDENTMNDSHVADPDYPDVPYGCTSFPRFRKRMSATVYTGGGSATAIVGVEIRGWKYGILNGVPQYSRAIFRRDRFGHVRDMLEQRAYSSFYDTVGYKSDGTFGGIIGRQTSPVSARFVGTDGVSVDPESTSCSNLSLEATSSLPFVDGVSTNRNPILYARLGTSLAAPFVLS